MFHCWANLSTCSIFESFVLVWIFIDLLSSTDEGSEFLGRLFVIWERSKLLTVLTVNCYSCDWSHNRTELLSSLECLPNFSILFVFICDCRWDTFDMVYAILDKIFSVISFFFCVHSSLTQSVVTTKYLITKWTLSRLCAICTLRVSTDSSNFN